MLNKKSNTFLSVISGGSGFIGINLVSKLLGQGFNVAIVDNFSNGQRSYLERFKGNLALNVIDADISDRRQCIEAFDKCYKYGSINEVWHLAANSDIPSGVINSDVDLKDTFLTTYELLHSMKKYDVKTFHFASSSAIYGDLGSDVLHENIGPLLPISNYGAMKLASEAQISAAAESFLKRVNIFRFPNVVGTPATHGVILDLINKLVADPNELSVLGDGTQKKAYLHVSDLVDAMLTIKSRKNKEKIEIVNIGPIDDGVTVRWIAEQVVARVSPKAKIVFGEGNKGWVGDVPRFNYSTARLQSYGWMPRLGSKAAVIRAIEEIALQKRCLKK